MKAMARVVQKVLTLALNKIKVHKKITLAVELISTIASVYFFLLETNSNRRDFNQTSL